MPVAVPPLGAARVTSGFGMRDHHPIRRDSGPVHHDGYDLAAPAGSPIFAARDGRVAFAGYRGGYGLMVELWHAGGLATRYSHAGSLKVRAGQFVQAGEILGFVGSTGLSSGPHLHYEVRLHGRPVDPRDAGFALASHEDHGFAPSRRALAGASGGRSAGMDRKAASATPGGRPGQSKAASARPGRARGTAWRASAASYGQAWGDDGRANAGRRGMARVSVNSAIAARPGAATSGAATLRAGDPGNPGTLLSRTAEMLLKHPPANRVE